MKEKCIFGPVQSRRLGMSLGINLTPYKTCSLDCAYCECGKTTDLTIIRKDYILIEQVQ
ncbi:MAG: radical SAM protein, partial [Atribacterota bacterium]|nr:radical SAM protein [Atribacterota bacterium]